MEITDLTNLQSSWEDYFCQQRMESLEARGIIQGTLSLNDRKKQHEARERNIKLYDVNFLYPIFRTVVNRLSKNYYSVDIKDDQNSKEKYTRVVTDVFGDSKEELNKCLEHVASDGYCCLFITKNEYSDSPSIKFINDSYQPFFDKFSLKDTMCDGAFCGYIVNHSKNTFKNIYGKEALNLENGYNNNLSLNMTEGIKVYYAWVKEEEDKIVKYEYTQNQILKKENSEYKVLPLVFIPVICYRDSDNIRLENIVKVSYNVCELLNNTLNIIINHIRRHQIYYLVDTCTIERSEAGIAQFEDPSKIVKLFDSRSQENITKSAPIVIPPVSFPKETLELFNILLGNLNSTWSTAIDVTLASKYDTISVLNEKQREADKGTSTNKLSHSWAIGMETVIRNILSISGVKKSELKKINIRETVDIQREKLVEIEMLSTIIPVVKSDIVQTQLLTKMLETRDKDKYKDVIDILNSASDMEMKQMQSNSGSPPEYVIRLQEQQLRSDTQIAIQKMQSSTALAQKNMEFIETMAKEELAKRKMELSKSKEE